MVQRFDVLPNISYPSLPHHSNKDMCPNTFRLTSLSDCFTSSFCSLKIKDLICYDVFVFGMMSNLFDEAINVVNPRINWSKQERKLNNEVFNK